MSASRRSETAGLFRSCAASAVVVLALAAWGCSRSSQPAPAGGAPATPAAAQAAGGAEFCDFQDGPADAKVKVVAFYPGRHEDTLAAVKSLLATFPGKVRVEIVDWRREEGLKRRDAAGLTCAAITINGKNAFDLEAGGKTSKVLFVRGIDAEWTKADLEAAVRKELGGAEAK